MLRIAFGVFMSGDVSEARQLLAEKVALRNLELAATERHLDRLREGRPETIETTSLHLDVLRDLRRYIRTSARSPILFLTRQASFRPYGRAKPI